MAFRENVNEAVRSIRVNLLRSGITISIISIGILALVAILTAVDAIKYKIDQSFAGLGALTFEVKQKGSSVRGNRHGNRQKRFPSVTYRQALSFKECFKNQTAISLSTLVSSSSEIKHLNIKTNPNCSVTGVDDYYILSENLDLIGGRNFTLSEIRFAVPVAIIGADIAYKLFGSISPLGKDIRLPGGKFRIIGLLKKAGNMLNGKSSDRQVLIPIDCARQIYQGENPSVNIKVSCRNAEEVEGIMLLAKESMRSIRNLRPNQADDFELTRSDNLASSFENITQYLRIGGFLVGFITILGAAIGLLNIMLVAVSERIHEIGIRKALGATPREIMQMFLIEAVMICQAGGFLGIILGVAAGNLVALFIGTGKFVIPWFPILLAFVICLLTGLLAGLFPAFKASKVNPIESLRYE